MDDSTALDLALLGMRVTLGVVLLTHGANHIWGGGRIRGTAGWFESLGMRPGIVHAWLASATELACGVLLILGLGTSLAAGGALGVMVVAWATNHRGNGFFTFRPGEGWEYVMVLASLSLGIATTGAGGWSVDQALELGWFHGASGLGIAALVGFGGALVLLVAAWRPAARADD